MLLVVVSLPASVDALQKAVSATSLALADVSRRLAGVLPRVLLAHASEERLAAVARQLEQAGFRVVVCDPAVASDDRARVVVRQLAFGPSGLVAHDGAPQPPGLPAASIDLIQRGFRAVTHTEKDVVRETKLAIVPLLVGLPLIETKVVTRDRT